MASPFGCCCGRRAHAPAIIPTGVAFRYKQNHPTNYITYKRYNYINTSSIIAAGLCRHPWPDARRVPPNATPQDARTLFHVHPAELDERLGAGPGRLVRRPALCHHSPGQRDVREHRLCAIGHFHVAECVLHLRVRHQRDERGVAGPAHRRGGPTDGGRIGVSV